MTDHSIHVDLLAARFSPGGPTLRETLAAADREAIAAAIAAADADIDYLPMPAAGASRASDARDDPWGDTRSSREGSR